MPTPTQPSQRFEIIDIIRGFALFGVLLANMVWTTQSYAVPEEQLANLPTVAIDQCVSNLIKVLVDYKFYTIFSMLFGLGFALQLSSGVSKNQNVLPTYSKRLVILLIMGIGHALLIWFGDILHVYALVGFMLILMRNWSDRTIFRLAVGIGVLVALLPFLDWLLAINPMSGSDGIAERFTRLSSNKWSEYVAVNWQFSYGEYSKLSLKFDGIVYWYLSVLWKFMIGFVMGRRLLLQDVDRYLRFYRSFLPWGLFIGVSGSITNVVSSHFGVWIPGQSSLLVLAWLPIDLSMFVLSLSYISAIVILYQNSKFKKILANLAPVGRMALTNYLSQSLLLILIFYGIGFGLLGKVGSSFCLLLSLLLFGIQIVFSKWWLGKYRFGPAEWAWRCLTYGKILPIKRKE